MTYFWCALNICGFGSKLIFLNMNKVKNPKKKGGKGKQELDLCLKIIIKFGPKPHCFTLLFHILAMSLSCRQNKIIKKATSVFSISRVGPS